ncbi:MAG: peptide chain release factor N(5)-glutamine methyltransferase, partial [Actinobacteria bacterium]|nr:peptide chain release factor N(5)-glutamine methyltransferase [Actinomycetota bacterium]
MSLPVSVLLRDVVTHAASRFAEAGIDSAQVDAELLAAHVLKLNRGQLQSAMIADQNLSEGDADELTNLYGRRIKREPLQHITGKAY